MNLVEDAWIPVRRRSGREERIAPWQVTSKLDSDPVVAVASPRADFDGSLAQLLIGLLQVALTPENPREWRKRLKQPPSSEELRSTFATLRPYFELLGDGPRFLQDLTLDVDDLKPEPIDRLLIDAPGGNTLKEGKDHFVKRGRVGALCVSCAASALLTLQTNAPSGGQGHRTGLRGGGPLTTLILDEGSLWATLWLNVLEAMAFPSGNPDRDQPADRFPWLAPTRTSEKKTGRETTPEDAHLLQMYWGMPRRIRLLAESSNGEPTACSLCARTASRYVKEYVTRNLGVNYTGPWRHPLSPHRIDESGVPFPRHGQTADLSYREWLGLVVADDEGKVKRKPATVVAAFRDRGLEDLRLWVFGYDMDNMKARAWCDGTMPLILGRPEDIAYLQRESGCLIRGAFIAGGALSRAAKEVIARRVADVRGEVPAIRNRFWQETEKTFYELLRRLVDSLAAGEDTVELRKRWHHILKTTCNRAFEDHSQSGHFGAYNPRQVAKAWQGLQKTLQGKKIRGALDLP